MTQQQQKYIYVKQNYSLSYIDIAVQNHTHFQHRLVLFYFFT